VAAFCGLLLISNVAAVKLIDLGPLTFDGGAILFPLTYIAGDVLAEVFGFRAARRAIIIGFVLSVIASLTFWAVGALPPAADWAGQPAWSEILGFVPRIVVASLAGYIVGQLLNSWVLVRIKRRFGPRRLWVRLLGSTLVGEAADTLVFCSAAFYGVLTGGAFWNYVIVGYIYKCVLEAVLLPLTYGTVRLVRGRIAAEPRATLEP
jgi:uncharacterized integral membrane protein (TIGR00697 family)